MVYGLGGVSDYSYGSALTSMDLNEGKVLLAAASRTFPLFCGGGKMKKAILLISSAVFLCSAASGECADKKVINVLFVGNSLTSANDLPGMVAAIAKSRRLAVNCESYAPGGARLSQHASNPEVAKKIKEKPWDFVVFQEQSQLPAFPENQLSRAVFPYAKKLTETARSANSKTKVVFYMTMAHRNGDPDNKNVFPELETYEGMQQRVNRCYREIEKDNEVLIAPVGEVWQTAIKQKPKLDLYADDVHPNKTGTYLAACVFYVTLFDKETARSSIPRGVDRKAAKYIQSEADKLIVKEGDKQAQQE